jgi:hypothetical protein
MKRIEYGDTLTCIDCGVEKSLTEFWKKGTPRTDGTFGYRAYCRDCGTDKRLHVYHNEGGKEKQKKRSFKNNLKKYGITPENYQEFFNKQEGKCAICSSSEVSVARRSYNLFVDHDHKTGKVRGLLCHHCNTGLGQYRDNTELLQKAIEYLNANRT